MFRNEEVRLGASVKKKKPKTKTRLRNSYKGIPICKTMRVEAKSMCFIGRDTKIKNYKLESRHEEMPRNMIRNVGKHMAQGRCYFWDIKCLAQAHRFGYFIPRFYALLRDCRITGNQRLDGANELPRGYWF